jgi:hypothetical protein
MLFLKFTTTDKGCLENLFGHIQPVGSTTSVLGMWLHLMQLIGRTNITNLLLFFPGCNHHGETTIFWLCALVYDETRHTSEFFNTSGFITKSSTCKYVSFHIFLYFRNKELKIILVK